MLPVLLFPQFDPAMIRVGPIAIRWYAMAYIAGLVIAWRLVRRLAARAPSVATGEQIDDFLTWATLGVVFGGRLGYVAFYQPAHYLAHPIEALAVWRGGMSFHGGAIGVIVAIFAFCWRRRLPALGFADRVVTAVPVGLGLGRAANFINGELWGRVASDRLPWATVFPQAGPEPRHPSQLYQAGMEGLLLFALLFALSRSEAVRSRFGLLSGVFLAGYAVARAIGELFREPDPFLGYLWSGATMGQLLSAPMFAVGLWLILRARPRRALAAPP